VGLYVPLLGYPQSAGRSEPSRASGDQHRRPRRLSVRRCATQRRRRSERGLSASAGAIFEQRARAGPPRHQAAGQRQSAFPIILCRSAHARRLRSDPYDPQRPGFWKCAGNGHRFAPSLYSRSVRCDELNFRSATPTFGSTAKSQHIQIMAAAFSELKVR
jgi:hypothetical protein